MKQNILVGPVPVVLGGTYSFPLPRESIIEGLDLLVEGNVDTISSSPPVEGLPSLVREVTVRGSLASGTVEPLVGLSGPDLAEVAQFHRGSYPRQVGSLGATGGFVCHIPVDFRENFLGDEATNLAFALPAYAASDMSITFRIGTQSELGGGIAISGARAYCLVRQLRRDVVGALNIQHARGVYEVKVDTGITTQLGREIELPTGSKYSLMLIRSFSGSNTKQTGNAPISDSSLPSLTLFDLGRYVVYHGSFAGLRAQNLPIVLDNLIDGNACLVFNRGIQNLYDAGTQGASVATVRLVYNAQASTGASVRVVTRRLFI